LPPIEGRAVLSGLQSSVKVDISGIIVTEKTIIVDGQNIVLNIVKPENAKGILPVLCFFMGLGARRFPTHQRMVRDLV
jgi:hypothetical protein